jgi:hypothetical protein
MGAIQALVDHKADSFRMRTILSAAQMLQVLPPHVIGVEDFGSVMYYHARIHHHKSMSKKEDHQVSATSHSKYQSTCLFHRLDSYELHVVAHVLDSNMPSFSPSSLPGVC